MADLDVMQSLFGFLQRHVQTADAVTRVTKNALEAPFLQSMPNKLADVHTHGVLQKLRSRTRIRRAGVRIPMTNAAPFASFPVVSAMQRILGYGLATFGGGMEIEVVVDAGATIGESPTWASSENALYWIDVKKPALHRYDAKTGGQRCWLMPSDIGAFALASHPPGAVVALRYGIFRLEFDTSALSLLVDPPFDPNLFRFNEGACDTSGRFWIGVMFDPLDQGCSAQKSSLHSFTLHDGLRSEPDAAELHNGMAWSADGLRFYLSHSNRREVFAFAFD